MINLKKYLVLIRQSWLDSLAYRGEIYMQLVAWAINFILYIYLWEAIYNVQGKVGGYSITNLFTYFLTAGMVRSLVFSHIGFIVASDIKNGDLVNTLTKPISPIPMYYSIEIGRNFLRFVLGFIVNVIIFFIWRELFDFSSFSTGSIMIGFVTCILAHFINFCFMMIIGGLSFFITDSQRLLFFYFAFITLLGGYLLPIDMFPEAARDLTMLTPFPYTFFFVAKTFQGTLSPEQITNGILMQVMWGIICGITMYYIFKKGLKKFESVGR